MGTAAFGNTTEEIIEENTTHKEQIRHDKDAIIKVVNKGKIEINLDTPKFSDDLSGIRLREESENGQRKELINNGRIEVKLTDNNKDFRAAVGVKLLGNASIINNGDIKVNANDGSIGILSMPTDNFAGDRNLVENNGTIEVNSTDGTGVALRVNTRKYTLSEKFLVVNNGTLKTNGGNVVELQNGRIDFTNNGSIVLSEGNEYAISATSDKSIGTTITNKGIISVPRGGKVALVLNNGTEGQEKESKIISTGIIKISDRTKEELKKENFDVKTLFKTAGNVKYDISNGMLVDKDGIAVGRDGDLVIDKEISSPVINELGKNNGKVILTDKAEIKGGTETINIGALELRGDVKVTGDNPVKIEDTTINLDKNGKLSIEDKSTLSIKGNNINKSEKGTAIALGDGSTLSLDGVTVINGAIGDAENKGTVEAKNTTINGNIASANFNVIGGTKEEVNTTTINGEIAVGAITVGGTFKSKSNIAGDKVVTDKLVLSSDSKFTNTTGSTLTINKNGQVFLGIDKDGKNAFKNTTEASVTVKGDGETGTTDLVLETGNLSGDNIKVEFGNNITFTTTTVGTDSKIYVVDKNKAELNGTNKDVIVSYNTKLYEDNTVLNNVNNAAKVVSNLFSNDVAEREVQLDKIYSSNIYSETVKAAYDTVKMNEEAVLSLARKSEVGKWTAEGKALYSKDEYDRKGIVGEYSSEIESTGLMAAFGYGLNETTTAGVAFSGVKQDVDTDGGSADADLFYLGVYGNKVYGNYDFTAGLGYQFGEYEADNTIANVHGSDKYDSKALSGYVQGRYTADLGDGLSLQPRVRLGYTYVEQDDARDSYFGVSDAEISTFDAEFGLDTVKSVQLEKSKVDVKFGVSYVRTMGDTDDEFTGRFYGTTASEGFDVLGAELAENVVKFNLGAEVTNENGFFYNGGFTYEFGSNDTDAYGVNVGVGYRF